MEPFITVVVSTNEIIKAGKAEDFKLFLQLFRLQTYKNTECLVIDNVSKDGTK